MPTSLSWVIMKHIKYIYNRCPKSQFSMYRGVLHIKKEFDGTPARGPTILLNSSVIFHRSWAQSFITALPNFRC